MIKKDKGVTLVALVITIALMMIISSAVVYNSYKSFEVNHMKKMLNDLELLEDKVSNYYLKYKALPVLAKYSIPSFERNSGDNDEYYIIDLEAMEGIALNYGKDFKNASSSNDIYIINELTHTIYYVKGIEMDGVRYHYKNVTTVIGNNSQPSRPQINVISGTKTGTQAGVDIYSTDISIEVIPGKNNVYGVGKTEYSIDNGTTWKDYTDVFQISGTGIYTIIVKTYDILHTTNFSQITKIVLIEKVQNNYS